MRPADLKSRGITFDAVEAALAREHRPGVRKRLVAVGNIVQGKSIKKAARAAKATRGSVEHWLKQVRQSGLQALLVDRRLRYEKREMTPAQVKEARRQVATALAGPLKPQVRARLIAIDAVLSGRPIDEAAAAARVLPNTVKGWLRVISRRGVDATVAQWQTDRRLRPSKLDADPAILRELATKEKNPRVRKRMLALACVAEGMGVYDAEVRVGLNRLAITKWVKRFREEGIAALQDGKIAGRPHKLDAAQLENVGSIILERPMISHAELRDLVWARFRVRYSPRRLRHLLKTKLGIRWKPARSQCRTCRRGSQKGVGGPLRSGPDAAPGDRHEWSAMQAERGTA